MLCVQSQYLNALSNLSIISYSLTSRPICYTLLLHGQQSMLWDKIFFIRQIGSLSPLEKYLK